MQDQEAIEILLKLKDKYPLSDKEKTALMSAIGVSDWTKLGESRIKRLAQARKIQAGKKFK